MGDTRRVNPDEPRKAPNETGAAEAAQRDRIRSLEEVTGKSTVGPFTATQPVQQDTGLPADNIKANWPMQSFDGREWANAFKETVGRGLPIDEAQVHSWFAAALMRGYDEGARVSTGNFSTEGFRTTDKVAVKLTDAGKQRWRDYTMGMHGTRKEPEVNTSGYTLMPLFELFAIYGGAPPYGMESDHYFVDAKVWWAGFTP